MRIQINMPKVIISFPHLFEKEPLNQWNKIEDMRQYVATFLLSKDNAKHVSVIDQIKDAEKKILAENGVRENPYPTIKDGDIEHAKLPDGDDKSKLAKEKRSYLKGHWIIKAKSKFEVQLQNKGYELDINVDANPFYAGCYVNAIFMMQPYPKGVSKFLKFVQFVEDGNAIGGGKIIASNYFERVDNSTVDAVAFEANDEDLF